MNRTARARSTMIKPKFLSQSSVSFRCCCLVFLQLPVADFKHLGMVAVHHTHSQESAKGISNDEILEADTRSFQRRPRSSSKQKPSRTYVGACRATRVVGEALTRSLLSLRGPGTHGDSKVNAGYLNETLQYLVSMLCSH